MAWLARLRGACSLRLVRIGAASGRSIHPQTIPIAAATGLLAAAAIAIAGCGNQYRPVISPIQPTGPASMPTAGIVVMSQPGFLPLPTGANPCASTSYSTPSIITLVNFSGDTIENQANGGIGPLTFSLEAGGANVYSPNCDGTLTTAVATTVSLLSKNVQSSTLLPGSVPTNTIFASSSLYVTEEGLHGLTCSTTGSPASGDCVGQLGGSPEGLRQNIPVAPSLMNLVGYSSGQRIYAISQGNSGGGAQPAWGDCDNPSAVGVNGEADAIETITNTVSAHLPLGVCPVFGFQTPDLQRTFIVNRGSGTVSVINSELNALDTTNSKLGPNATIPVGAGPVYADYYRNGQILVTANYDSNTISIIDVSLDQFNNDSATFGTVKATIPVGLHPVEVSVLQDGSRAYVANQGVINPDGSVGTPGSVSIVNLNNYSVEETIGLIANPHAIGSIYNYPVGKVYVVSQNSPYLTVIRTDTDIVSATPEMQGPIVDMRVSAQYPAQSSSGALNYQTESRSVGSGAP